MTDIAADDPITLAEACKLFPRAHLTVSTLRAERDHEFISKTAQAQIKAALAKKPNATVYTYPGQRHAFSRHNGTHYNAAAAALANGRTSEFLNQHLR